MLPTDVVGAVILVVLVKEISSGPAGLLKLTTPATQLATA